MEKKYLYHCTRKEYLSEILLHGLKAENPQRREYKHKGVYLSTYQFNWMWNTTREGRFKGAILKIDVTGLKLIKDYHIDSRDSELNSKLLGDDFIYLSDIPPERIVNVAIETEPHTFQDLMFDIIPYAEDGFPLTDKSVGILPTIL